jgi:hypothetical protein
LESFLKFLRVYNRLVVGVLELKGRSRESREQSTVDQINAAAAVAEKEFIEFWKRIATQYEAVAVKSRRLRTGAMTAAAVRLGTRAAEDDDEGWLSWGS